MFTAPPGIALKLPRSVKAAALAVSLLLSALLTAVAVRSPDDHWLAWISFLPLFVAVLLGTHPNTSEPRASARADGWHGQGSPPGRLRSGGNASRRSLAMGHVRRRSTWPSWVFVVSDDFLDRTPHTLAGSPSNKTLDHATQCWCVASIARCPGNPVLAPSPGASPCTSASGRRR